MNNPELGNPTFLALNVLAQATQSREPSPTSRGRADVNPVLMGRASKMLIQCCQRIVVAMTQVAFICLAVPGPAAGIILGIVARSATGEQTGRIGNYVVCVVLTNNPVDGDTVHSRSTFASFKVKDERRARDKFHATPVEWTSNILWTMNRRPEVLQTRFISKHDTDWYWNMEDLRSEDCSRIGNPSCRTSNSGEGSIGDSALANHIRWQRSFDKMNNNSGIRHCDLPIRRSRQNARCKVDNMSGEDSEPNVLSIRSKLESPWCTHGRCCDARNWLHVDKELTKIQTDARIVRSKSLSPKSVEVTSGEVVGL